MKKRIYFAIFVLVAILFLFKTRGLQGPPTQLDEQTRQFLARGSPSKLALPKDLLQEVRERKALVQAFKNEKEQQKSTISPVGEVRVMERVVAESKGWGVEIPSLSVEIFMAMPPNQEIISSCDISFFDNVNRCKPDKCVTTFKTAKGLRSQKKEILGKVDGICHGILKVDNYTFYCRSNNYNEIQRILSLLASVQRIKVSQFYSVIKFANDNCKSYKRM